MQKSNIKIEWLTKSIQMKSFIDNVKDIQYDGGNLYEIEAIKAIQAKYLISINENYIKNENIYKYFLTNHKRTIVADICIIDPYILALNKVDFNKYNIVMIHHIDERIYRKSILHNLFYKNLLINLKKVDLVVVVSKYWETFLKKKGIKNIKIIYNSYDLNHFSFNEKDIFNLKEKLQLDLKKPVIYIGKNSHGKGISEIINNIDCSKYNLVATGKEGVTSNKFKCVFLSKREFHMLLKISDLVLAMSTMPEGWNRIAHEAMLVKTAVIGSGSGGMNELLTNASQYIVTDFSLLQTKIEKALTNKTKLGRLGFDYVKKLDMQYFKNEWLKTISTALKFINN